MPKPELIRRSGWMLIAAAFVFLTLLIGSDPIAIPGSEISSILLAVGLLGLRDHYGERIGNFGRNALLLGASGPLLLILVIVMGLIGIITETQIREGLWVLLFGGPAISLLGLTLFGVVASHNKPLPRFNWLPFVAGIWYPVTYTIFSTYDISRKGVFPDQALAALELMVVIQFLALCILGLVLINDSSKEFAAA